MILGLCIGGRNGEEGARGILEDVLGTTVQLGDGGKKEEDDAGLSVPTRMGAECDIVERCLLMTHWKVVSKIAC